MENPQYGESVNREIPQYINKTNLIKTNPPTALNPNEQTGANVVQKMVRADKGT